MATGGTMSPANGLAILAVVRGTAKHPSKGLLMRAPVGLGRIVRVGRQLDGLETSHILPICRNDLVSARTELRGYLGEQIRLQVERVGRLRVGEARRIAGCLRVGPEVDHGDEHLRVALRL